MSLKESVFSLFRRFQWLPRSLDGNHLIRAIPNSRFLDCQAHGEVPIKVTWLKNGAKVSENKRIQVLSNGSLYISEVEGKRGEQYDEGFYQCLAMNRHGAILSQKAHLTLSSKCLSS
jgi:hypothetical protein